MNDMDDEILYGADLGNHIGSLIRPDADDDLDRDIDRKAVLGDHLQRVETGIGRIVPVDGQVGGIDDVRNKSPLVEVVAPRPGNLFLDTAEPLGHHIPFPGLLGFGRSGGLRGGEPLLHLRGRLFPDIGNDYRHLPPLHHRHIIQLHLEHEGIDVVGTGTEYVQLRTALAAGGEELLGILIVVMAEDRLGDVFGFREGAAVEGADQTDLAGGDDGSIEDLDPEEVQVDPVGTRLEDIDLRPLLAAVFQKCLAALEIGMALDALSEEPPRRDFLTVHGGYDPDLPLVDIDGVTLGDIELVRVDPVFTRRGDLDLRPLLATVGQKDLAVLKGVMPFDHLGKDPARRDRVAVDRLDDADLAVLDLDKGVFLRRIDEGDQEMEAWA